MRIHSISQPTTLYTRDGRRHRFKMKNVDVVMSTNEINSLIADLRDLKKEGRWPKGCHVHLNADDHKSNPRVQVTLCHEKSYPLDPKATGPSQATIIEL